MLELRKTGFLSSDYHAVESDAVVAELNLARLRSRGEIEVQERTLHVDKQGVLKDTFALRDGDRTLIEIVQPQALRSGLEFRYDGTDYDIRSESWLRSTLIVATADGTDVGRIRQRGVFASGAIVDLPADWPLPLRVFIGWVAMVRWEEAVAAGAAG